MGERKTHAHAHGAWWSLCGRELTLDRFATTGEPTCRTCREKLGLPNECEHKGCCPECGLCMDCGEPT